MSERLRIAVLGDSGVGKSTLLSLLLSYPTSASTGGFEFAVGLYESARFARQVYIEFIVVPGHSKHAKTRAMGFQGLNGILLVHDLANNKSYQNLYRWVAEIQDAIEKGAPSLSSSAINIRTDHEYTPKTILLPPTMQIGNKSDLYMASLPPVIEKIKTFETCALSHGSLPRLQQAMCEFYETVLAAKLSPGTTKEPAMVIGQSPGGRRFTVAAASNRRMNHAVT